MGSYNVIPYCNAKRVNSLIYGENGECYTVLSDSTWADFVESDFNTNEIWSLDMDDCVLYNKKYCKDKNGALLKSSDIIEDDYTFIDSGIRAVKIKAACTDAPTTFWEYFLRIDVTWREFVSSKYSEYVENDGSIKKYWYLSGNTIVFEWNGYKGTAQVNPDGFVPDGFELWFLTCFVAGTKILTAMDGTVKNIEDFKEGDEIISYNRSTKEFYTAFVSGVIRHEEKHELSTRLVRVEFENGEALNMTTDHPILTENGWRTVENEATEYVLKVGDRAIGTEGATKVVSIDIYDCAPTPTYCLMVRDYGEKQDNDADDNFIANGVVAHNQNTEQTEGTPTPPTPPEPPAPPEPPRPYTWQN